MVEAQIDPLVNGEITELLLYSMPKCCLAYYDCHYRRWC